MTLRIFKRFLHKVRSSSPAASFSQSEAVVHFDRGVDLHVAGRGGCWRRVQGTPQRALSLCVETYVLKHSTRVAMRKLPGYLFFIVRDEDDFRLVKPQNPRSYLPYD